MNLVPVHHETLPVEQIGDADNPRRDIRIGAGIAFLFFVVLLGWAAFAPLDAGIYAPGSIAVSGNRQAVQSRDGGIVGAIAVEEGQTVRQGDLLVSLSAPDLKSNERALASEYFSLLAQRARLLAERSGASTIVPPPEFGPLTGDDRRLADEAMRFQQLQLRARAGSESAQTSVLSQRSRQLGAQQSGYVEQRASVIEQRRILSDELAGMKQLEERGFASKNRIRALERAVEELRGREAALTAEIARAGEGMGETSMQSLSIKRTTIEEAAAELRDTQTRLSDVLPRLVTVRERLRNSELRAPASGKVVGLSVFTVGGVVAPGQTVMEIVPDRRRLVIQAQVRPSDADDVYPGQVAQLRFSSVNDRTLPMLEGKVKTISADRLTDQNSGQSYYVAEIEVAPDQLDRVRASLGQGQLRPGLPVETIMAARKRTALQYLLEPLTAHFWRAMREQ